MVDDNVIELEELGRSRRDILRKAGYPERMWEPCGFDKKGNQLWCSRPATNKEWKERWENYMKMRERLIARNANKGDK